MRKLVTEGNFEVDNEGIKLQIMDSSHVSLVGLLVSRHAFSSYHLSPLHGESMTLGLNLNTLSKILRFAEDKDPLKIECRQQLREVQITIGSEDGDGHKTSVFTIRVLDVFPDQYSIPGRFDGCEVKLSSSQFKTLCRDLGTFGDSVEISVMKDEVQFSTSGAIGNAHIHLRAGELVDGVETQVVLQEGEVVRGTFALRYLNTFTEATGISPSVTLRLSLDLPIFIEYGSKECISLQYFLAPKIEEEISDSES